MTRLAAGLTRWLRRGAVMLLMLVVLLAIAFGLLQTSTGREWLEDVAARVASTPASSIAIVGLDGTIPFDMRAARIEISDEHGAWLVIRQPRIDLSATELLRGRVHIHALTADAIEVTRLPTGQPTPSMTPISERLRVPQLPVGIVVDRLAVDRITLGPDVSGEPVEAVLVGDAALTKTSARISLDLHRTDGRPGALDLRLAVVGSPPVLNVQVTADEPSGALLDRLFLRNDHLPLSLSFVGEGPLAQWHGRLNASGGTLAGLDFDVTFAVGQDTVVTVAGNAAVAPLLIPEIAKLIGDKVPVHLRAGFAENGLFTVDELSVGLAAGTITGEAILGDPDRRLVARLQGDFGNLSGSSDIVGQPVEGSARITATLSGTEVRPSLSIDASGNMFRVGGGGARQAEAHLTVGLTGERGQPGTRIDLAAEGSVRGAIFPETLAVPPELNRDLDWSLKVRMAPEGGSFDITQIAVRGIGIDLAGSGRFGPGPQVSDGRLHLSVADLRPFATAFGQSIEGSLTLDGTQSGSSGNQVVELQGSLGRLRVGVPAVDALTGGSVAISGAIEQSSQNAWTLHRFTVSGSGAKVTANGRFEPETRRLTAAIEAEIPSLKPLGAVLGDISNGRVSGRVALSGVLDHMGAEMELDGSGLQGGDARLAQIHLEARMPDVQAAKVAIEGRFRHGNLSGTLGLEVDGGNPAELLIPRLRVQAADSTVEGGFRIDRTTLLSRGTLVVRVPDLSRWSSTAGLPLAGSFGLRAELEQSRGQNVDLTATADRLSFGPAGSRVGLGKMEVSWRLADAFNAPTGKAQARITALTLTSGRLDEAKLSLTSVKPGRFAFTADAKGRFADPISFASRGEYQWSPRGRELQVAAFAGEIGGDRLQLTAPLKLTQNGADYSLSNLALSLGSGRISGNAALRGRALAGRLTVKNLPVALAARLVGQKGAGGTMTLDANVAGTAAAPTGRFSLTARDLTYAQAGHRLSSLSIDSTGDWNGRKLALKGKIGGLKGETLGFSGSIPVVFNPAPLSLSIPPSGRLTMRLEGSGDLSNLADLLPIGEDRLSGRFTLDAGVTGTPAAPAASGRLTVTGGRYESFASGAVLTNLRFDLSGDRDRFTLRALTASDSANGNLAARGTIELGRSGGPGVELSAKLTRFRIAVRDEAVVTASGDVTVVGPVFGPKVTGRLTVDRADCTIPDSLPPSVTKLKVVEINDSASATPSPRPANRGMAPQAASQKEPPAFAAPLDIQIALPGKTFVRGHGLDSEWRGQLEVSGTSAAPAITGSIESIRGTFDILGRTFRVATGVIAFDGGPRFDPRLYIAAEVAAADITAQAIIGGVASAPTITLSSVPAVPQDEILSRVLFKRGLGQISAGEGLQVAQAAATLAGGGPGVLDKLRSGLGLDRLSFGAAANGPASSNLNPAAGGNATGNPGPALSGGKYVASGVYVGATQGTTPQSSKMTVEIDVYPHVTIETERSQSGSTGLGLNYKYDY